MNMTPIIGILTAIGLVCGLIIYLVYIKVPQKVKGLEKTEEINSILPGMNCGAWRYLRTPTWSPRHPALRYYRTRRV